MRNNQYAIFHNNDNVAWQWHDKEIIHGNREMHTQVETKLKSASHSHLSKQ